MTEFVTAARRRYPDMVFYDRNEEARRAPSSAPVPRHPEVADVDAVFSAIGGRETVTIRSCFGHRFFNHDRDSTSASSTHRALLLKRMVDAVGDLLIAPPPPPPPDEPEDEPEDLEESLGPGD